MTAAKTISFGVIGCGLIAQAVHIPTLLGHPNARLDIVCDPNEYRRDLAGGSGAVTCADPACVLDSKVDAVLIATHDLIHAELVAAALAAGKHVFVEKPLSLESTRAWDIVAQARAADRVVSVGFQRLHDPLVARLVAMLPQVGEIELLHMHDICHDNTLVTVETVTGSIASAAFQAGRSDYSAPDAWAKIVARVHGSTCGEYLGTYRLMHNLVCHDLSLLIRIFGAPLGVDFAHFTRGGFGLIVYTFPAGRCVLEFGQTQHKCFDQRLRVIGTRGTLDAAWATPFVPGIPSELTVTTMSGTSELSTTERMSHASLFQLELGGFIDSVLAGGADDTSLTIAAMTTEWLERAITAQVDQRGAPLTPKAGARRLAVVKDP